ncbi:MAG TPA: CBS domain-containing protein, partial [Phaeodactylibacter sp.]|nr:CBS domain-containing protein [Phaeodactylibacter sp.]
RFYLSRMQCFARRSQKSRLGFFALGAVVLGALIYLMPPLYGEGYSVVNYLLEGKYENLLNHTFFYQFTGNSGFLIAFAFLLIFAKALATSITIGIGGHGGIFAPSMFMGAMLGFTFAYSLNSLGVVSLSEANFIAVAMAGTLSGVIKAPLTGIFLIAEITGGYSLIVPLMIVSAVSYFVAYFFEPHSIFTKDLANKGLWVPPHERDKHILKHMNLEKLVETNFHILYPNQTLGQFVKIISKSHRNLFPVVDEDGYFLGVVLLDDVRNRMFDQQQYDKLHIRDFMHMPQTTVDITDPMDSVMEKFDYYNIWNIPVLRSGRYMGFVSKSSVFNRYRELLKNQSEGI